MPIPNVVLETNVYNDFIREAQERIAIDDFYMARDTSWKTIEFNKVIQFIRKNYGAKSTFVRDVYCSLFAEKFAVNIYGTGDTANDMVSQELTAAAIGEESAVVEFMAAYRKFLSAPQYDAVKENFVTWWLLNERDEMVHVTLPIKQISFLPEVYPYIGDVDKYVDDYKNASQPILILTGEPGTGKTTFINYMIKKFKWSAYTTYDPTVMSDDRFFIQFLSNNNANALILEDADTILHDRLSKNNDTMSKFLNVSDGLLDIGSRKIIMTANIQNKNDIDEAIIRPGRCFDILEFRKLSAKEAGVISTNLPDKEDFSIAEVINNRAAPKRGFGW